MEQQSAKEALTLELASKGIFGAAFEPEVDKIYASIPESTRSSYPEDKYEAVMQFMPIYSGANTPAGTPANTQVQTGTATPTVNTAQAKLIKTVLAENKARKEETTLKTVIKRLLIDKPDPSTYLKPEMTIIPTIKEEKLAEYENKLDRTDTESVNAFQTLVDAVKNQKPVQIYIPEGQKKVVGFDLLTPSAESGNTNLVPKVLTYAAMVGFVTTKTQGYIPTKGDGLGVKLRWNKPRTNTKASSRRAIGSPALVIGGKKDALENPNMHEVISKVAEENGVVVTKKGKLRTDLSFRIDTGKTKANGEKIYRKVRLTGTAEVPKFVRISDEIEQIFGSGEKDRNLIQPPTGEEADVLEQAMVNTVAYMAESGASRFNVSEFLDAFAAADNTSSAAANVEL